MLGCQKRNGSRERCQRNPSAASNDGCAYMEGMECHQVAIQVAAPPYPPYNPQQRHTQGGRRFLIRSGNAQGRPSTGGERSTGGQNPLKNRQAPGSNDTRIRMGSSRSAIHRWEGLSRSPLARPSELL